MDFLSNIVQQVITVLYNMTATVGLPNYGLAIIIMTIIVKILLYPLTKTNRINKSNDGYAA